MNNFDVKKALPIIILIVAIIVLILNLQVKREKVLEIVDVGNELAKKDLIVIVTPRPNDTVKSPLTITGKARGYWMFEGSFPVLLKDSNGVVIVEHYAMTDENWMTEEFVPFTATLEFKNTPTSNKGTLTLKKDNPSGLPEYDDELIIPVSFE